MPTRATTRRSKWRRPGAQASDALTRHVGTKKRRARSPGPPVFHTRTASVVVALVVIPDPQRTANFAAGVTHRMNVRVGGPVAQRLDHFSEPRGPGVDALG